MWFNTFIFWWRWILTIQLLVKNITLEIIIITKLYYSTLLHHSPRGLGFTQFLIQQPTDGPCYCVSPSAKRKITGFQTTTQTRGFWQVWGALKHTISSVCHIKLSHADSIKHRSLKKKKKKAQEHAKSTGLKYTNVGFGRGLKCSPRTDHSPRWNRECHNHLVLVCLCPQQINKEKSSALKGVDLTTPTVGISLVSLCLAGRSRLRFPRCRCPSSVFELQSHLLHREHVAPCGASFFPLSKLL